MSDLKEFLLASAKWRRSAEPLTIVLGNESCDLDSAVCAICLAYFYQQRQRHQVNPNTNRNYLPVLNIPPLDLSLRPGLRKALGVLAGVTSDMLTFADDLDSMDISSVVMVDHNMLTDRQQRLQGRVEEIVDHRPDTHSFPDSSSAEIVKCIESVGSCASLVAHSIHSSDPGFLRMHPDVCWLLLTAIAVDTVDFNPHLDKTTPKDIQADKLLRAGLQCALSPGCSLPAPSTLLARFVDWDTDLAALETQHLLRKDLKLLSPPHHFASSDRRPLPVAVNALSKPLDFLLAREDLARALEHTTRTLGASLFIQMTLFSDQAPAPAPSQTQQDEKSLPPVTLRRQLLIYAPLPSRLFTGLAECLSKSDLSLVPWSKQEPLWLTFEESIGQGGQVMVFEQLNVAASRKQLMPLLTTFLHAEPNQPISCSCSCSQPGT